MAQFMQGRRHRSNMHMKRAYEAKQPSMKYVQLCLYFPFLLGTSMVVQAATWESKWTEVDMTGRK